MTRRLILCSCGGSQALDAPALEAATGIACSRVHNALCTSELPKAAQAMAEEGAIICCRQERRAFEALAAESDLPAPAFTDLRDRAGWSDDPRPKLPKMAALLAEAVLPASPVKSVDVVSEGLCLVIGRAETAVPAAARLADSLNVTVLITDDAEPPLARGFDAIRGRLRGAGGALGGFRLRIDALQQVDPAGRGALRWTAPRDGGTTECDIIVDLRGDTPLFPAAHKREGYLRADPGSPGAVADALLQAAQLIGTFEKPLYVAMQPALCAHSRAGQPGCRRCLDICPTGAIAPQGDHVAVDAMICAGCGACSAVCPSGAISYDAPPPETTMRRIHSLASAYLAAGGLAPRLLVCDSAFGGEMIALAARFGRGLPADVIPFETEALAAFGHAEMLAALGSGFAEVVILLAPRSERDAPARELALAAAIAGAERVRLIEPTDPEQLCDQLFAARDLPAPLGEPILPLGSRRQVTRLAARALCPETGVLALPEGAPYGAVAVDTGACTLCLSCVSLCPSGALVDNPDKPQLRFQEEACLQCGLCASACPERAITLTPRLDLTEAALQQRVLHEEEPFACVECGTPFGVRSTIERITERLAGKNALFADPGRLRLIQMCDDCRVRAQYHAQDNPFALGERPRVRTSDDYLDKRRDQ
ncbi:MAG: 4Fe-4S binding protein [Roseovarius sp.]